MVFVSAVDYLKHIIDPLQRMVLHLDAGHHVLGMVDQGPIFCKITLRKCLRMADIRAMHGQVYCGWQQL